MAKCVPAIVLAAGSSSRLGQPKALVEWNGETLVGRAVRLLQESGCKPIIVVTRSELQIDVMLSCKDATIVVNPNPEDGRTGTLQVGLLSLLSELGRTPRRVLISPVDRCGWNKETIPALLENHSNASPDPSGHPLLLCEIDKVLALSKESSLREQLEITRISAPGVHMNIDTPADLEALQ
ncbi:MAG: NTP transferase domain-containing protein [Euryarchaeota archaeon]|jgi:CTP:molybdopterin cytidylyltransferase MocA|nr:NTP transferase domain-containing protein [Euryarchaeota archaeon]MBT4982884.1 NTP transferase domain-containing protein [Euryarchaeota archaeon]